jgi:uncharacterized protein (TIGR03083 family)
MSVDTIAATCHQRSPDSYCDAVGAEIECLAAAARGAAPSTRVPACPEWSLAQLLEHVGTVHRWCGQMVRVRASQRLDPAALDLGLPAEARDYPDWVAAGAGPLVETLRAADPGAPMWAWGADKHARFWPRRMLHETTVHRADVEMARGRAPAIASAVAVDGIDEFLDNLPHSAYFAPNVTKLRGQGERLRFRCPEAVWTIELAPDRFTWEHGDSSEVRLMVEGSAPDLYLLLWGRLRPDTGAFTITGDEALLARWLANASL